MIINNSILELSRSKAMSLSSIITTSQQNNYNYNYSSWTDIDTPINFLSKDIIISVLQKYLITELAELISEFAMFFLDLTQFDLDKCYQLKSKPSEKHYMDNLVNKFGINRRKFPYNNMYSSIKCEIATKKIIDLTIDNKQYLFDNEILFFQHKSKSKTKFVNRVTCKISLQFLACHIEYIVKITNYEDFIIFLEKIYKESAGRLNTHIINYKNKNKERKLKELWEVWTKIFGPRFIYLNLQSLTEF